MSIRAAFRVQRDGFQLNVDAAFPSEGVTALFGPSGCGKTTLLRAIAGLDYHSDGLVSANGDHWQTTERFVPAHQRMIGYVFQQPNLFPHLTVQQNLDYALRRNGSRQPFLSLEAAISLLGLGPLLSRHPQKLSGGEQQRACIARAIAASPQLLLMDEPMSSLDAGLKAELLPYLDDLCAELDIPMIYVSHSLDEVARLADHLVLMENGAITATGDPQALLTRMDLPFALAADAESVIEATVVAVDEQYQLAYLDFCGGRFSLAEPGLVPGSRVKLRVPARDVSLTTTHQQGSSILNIFAATIVEMVHDDSARMVVKLDLQGAPLLARITRKSAALLNLEVGHSIFAQVKSVALVR